MKKKKILLGLALAAAAVFSLSACGEDTPATDTPTGDKPQETTKYTVTFNTNGGSTVNSQSIEQGKKVTKPADPTKTATDTVTYTFAGWFKDQALTQAFNFETETINAATTIYAKWTETQKVQPQTKFSVTYHTAHGTAPEALTEVEALPTELPTLEDDDYNFGGWALTENGTEAVTAGSAITANTDLYAIWTEKTAYEKVSTSADLLYEADFTTATVEPFDEEDPYLVTEGPQATVATTDKLKVEIVDGKLSVKDTDTSGTASARLACSYANSGIVEGALTVNFADSKNGGSVPSKQDIVQFNGYKDNKNENRLFALRSSTEKKLGIYFNGDDGNAEASYKGTLMTWEQGKDMEVYYKYDFATYKLTVKVNGTAIVEDYDVPEANRPLILSSLGFMTGGSADTRSVTVSRFAVKNSSKEELDTTKTTYKAKLEAQATAFDQTAYSFSLTEIQEALTDEKANIDAAESQFEVISIYLGTNLNNILSNSKIKETAVAILGATKEKLVSSYTYNKDAFDTLFSNAVAAVNAATTKAEYDAVFTNFETEFPKIKSDALVRADKLLEITNYIDTAKKALQDAGVDNTTQTQATLEITTAVANYIAATGDNSVNACAMTAIDDIVDAAKTAIDTIVAKYSLSVADLITQYNNALVTEIIEAKTYVAEAINYVSTYADSIASLAIDTTLTDKDEVETAYNDALAKIDALTDLFDKHYAAIHGKSTDTENNDLISYFNAKVATLLISSTDGYATSNEKDDLDALLDAEKAAIYRSTATDIANTLTAAKNDIDYEVESVKANTEVTVTFKAFEADTTAFATSTILKNGKVTAPETNPTSDKYVFAGWNFDFNNTVDENKTILAKWYDVYKSSQFSNSVYDFTTNSTSANVKTTKTYGEFTISNGSYTQFKEQNGYLSIFSGNTVTFTVDTDGAVFAIAYQGNNSSRYVTLTSTNSSYTTTKQYTNGTYLKASKTGELATVEYNGTNYSLEASAKGWLVFTNLLKGTYTMTVDTDESGKSGVVGNAENKIERMRLIDTKVNKATIKSITATVPTNTDNGQISLTDVKLIGINDNEIAITEGYTVTVKSQTDPTGTYEVNKNVPDGTYEVKITYGDFTVSQNWIVTVSNTNPE